MFCGGSSGSWMRLLRPCVTHVTLSQFFVSCVEVVLRDYDYGFSYSSWITKAANPYKTAKGLFEKRRTITGGPI